MAQYEAILGPPLKSRDECFHYFDLTEFAKKRAPATREQIDRRRDLALNPVLGYEKSTEIAQEAMETGRSVYKIVLEKGYLTKEELDDLLKPENMTRPRYIDYNRPS